MQHLQHHVKYNRERNRVRIGKLEDLTIIIQRTMIFNILCVHIHIYKYYLFIY